jgi:hypothetical protein
MSPPEAHIRERMYRRRVIRKLALALSEMHWCSASTGQSYRTCWGCMKPLIFFALVFPPEVMDLRHRDSSVGPFVFWSCRQGSSIMTLPH